MTGPWPLTLGTLATGLNGCTSPDTCLVDLVLRVVRCVLGGGCL